MERYILSIDQGTSSTKCLLVDRRGQTVRRASHAHRQLHPAQTFVEHDPEEIISGIQKAVSELTEGLPGGALALISLSVQTGAFVLWDAQTGKMVCNLIGWQDARGDALVRTMSETQQERLRRCGYTPNGRTIPMKLLWMKRNLPQWDALVAGGRLRFGTVDSYLLYMLTDGRVHACNNCNAGITRLYDMQTERWNEEVLQELGLPKEMFPKVLADDAIYGTCRWNGLSVPISGVMGDSAAAMFGQGCFRQGDVKVSYGTGASYLLSLGENPQIPPEGIVLGVAWKRGQKRCFAWEGTVFYAGAAIDYLIKTLRLPITLDGGEQDAARLAQTLSDNGGVYYVPALTGLGVPNLGQGDGGIICGLRPQSTLAHLARAALESVGYQVRDIAETIQAAGQKQPARFIVDGGGSRNTFTMQFQADILGIPVVCSEVEECSALGAAFMGGLACGVWSSTEELSELTHRPGKVYMPKMNSEMREQLYSGWRKSVERVRQP